MTRAVILGGGRSRRMGQDKASLRLDAGANGETLLERLVRGLEPIVAHVGVSIAADGPRPRARGIDAVYRDADTDRGPLEGVRAALESMAESRALFVAVDTVCLPAEALLALARSMGDRTRRGAMIRAGDRLQPTLGIYDRQLLERLEPAVRSDHRSLSQLADWEGVDVVDFTASAASAAGEGTCTLQGWALGGGTLNRPEELQRLREAIARGALPATPLVVERPDRA